MRRRSRPMPNARPTPGLRLTPERRAQIERRVQRSLLSLADPDEGSPTPEWPDVYAEDAGDLLHDLDVLEHEVERLREALEAILGEIADEAAGHETEWPAWVRRVWQIAVRAASAQKRGEGA